MSWLVSALTEKASSFLFWTKVIAVQLFDGIMAGEQVVLNVGDMPETAAGDSENSTASAVAEDLQRSMLDIKADFMAEDGGSVNYKAMRESQVFADYKMQSRRLRTVDILALSENEKMAFFLNVYNALTIHGLAAMDALPASVLEVQGFWRRTCYNIGGFIFSLDDIEHGILRGNRLHPSGKALFPEGDPRLKFTVANVDPRLHFALVCGAQSCPPINVYLPRNLNYGLRLAASNFCKQEVIVDTAKKEVQLSKIFSWYKTDFGSTDTELLRWILPFMLEAQRPDLQSMIDLMESNEKVSVIFRDYNWKLNATEEEE